jgi:hypothetical protein
MMGRATRHKDRTEQEQHGTGRKTIRGLGPAAYFGRPVQIDSHDNKLSLLTVAHVMTRTVT